MTQEEEVMYLSNLGIRLKQLRKDKGMTQADLGIDERTIRRIEGAKENYNPSFLQLVEIAKTLQVDVKDLVDFSAL